MSWTCDDCGACSFFPGAAPEFCPFCADDDMETDTPGNATTKPPVPYDQGGEEGAS